MRNYFPDYPRPVHSVTRNRTPFACIKKKKFNCFTDDGLIRNDGRKCVACVEDGRQLSGVALAGGNAGALKAPRRRGRALKSVASGAPNGTPVISLRAPFHDGNLGQSPCSPWWLALTAAPTPPNWHVFRQICHPLFENPTPATDDSCGVDFNTNPSRFSGLDKS